MSFIDGGFSECSDEYHEAFFKSVLSFMDESDSDEDIDDLDDQTSGYDSLNSESFGSTSFGDFLYPYTVTEEKHESIPVYKNCARPSTARVSWTLSSRGSIFTTKEQPKPKHKLISCASNILTEPNSIGILSEEFNILLDEEIRQENSEFQIDFWPGCTSTPGKKNLQHSSSNASLRRKNDLLVTLLRNKNLDELENHPAMSTFEEFWEGSEYLMTNLYYSRPVLPTYRPTMSMDKENWYPTIKNFKQPIESYYFCKFCLKNGEVEKVYSSHILKSANGDILCPILRKYVCEFCGATGRSAHTRKHCPLYIEQNEGENFNYRPVFRRLASGILIPNFFHK